MFRMFPRKLQKLFTVQAYQELALKTSRLLDSLGVYDDTAIALIENVVATLSGLPCGQDGGVHVCKLEGDIAL